MGADEPELVFDPEDLAPRQRSGEACVLCAKAWPLPRARVGRLPGGGYVYACRQCAEAIPKTVAEALARRGMDSTQPHRVMRLRHPWTWLRLPWPKQRQV